MLLFNNINLWNTSQVACLCSGAVFQISMVFIKARLKQSNRVNLIIVDTIWVNTNFSMKLALRVVLKNTNQVFLLLPMGYTKLQNAKKNSKNLFTLIKNWLVKMAYHDLQCISGFQHRFVFILILPHQSSVENPIYFFHKTTITCQNALHRLQTEYKRTYSNVFITVD